METAPDQGNVLKNTSPRDARGEGQFETPTDVFRRNLTAGILVGVGIIFIILIGGCVFVLWKAAENPATANDKALTGAITVITTSVGIVGGLASTAIGYFFNRNQS